MAPGSGVPGSDASRSGAASAPAGATAPPTTPAPTGAAASPAGGAQTAAEAAVHVLARGSTEALNVHSVASLGWLRGCWLGKVNGREFREQWSPAEGGMMVGTDHMVMNGRTEDFAWLRLEQRGDIVDYVITPKAGPSLTFHLTKAEHDKDSDGDVYTFANAAAGYPSTILYHRGAEGWLYATVDGTVNGAERKVIYPMRHVDCRSDAFLRD